MIVGTRESKLAMRQTQIFLDLAREQHPETEFTIKGMKSSGDLDLTSSLDELQGFGAFVRELDAALLSGTIDVAVNSMKDMPIQMPDGICIPAVLPRAAAEDVLIPCSLDELHAGAVVGTSSIRRAAMLKSLRPDLNTAQLRGNIQTRISKLDDGEYDAIILAKAGLDRMSIQHKMSVLSIDDFIPAPAQGAIAVTCRSDKPDVISILRCINDQSTLTEVTVERGLMRLMGAGCSSPIGINAKLSSKNIRVRAISFEYSEIPIKIDVTIPIDYTKQDLFLIASSLKGEY
ncbi:MAG: hydroxymethylbilane synthase [Candidatus Methanomethylophilaceae archaeon]|jgi:hydroxymethylbilane synthase